MNRKKISVLEIIEECQKALSADEMLDFLESKQNLKVNKTTVYRQISKLLETNLIHEIELEGNRKILYAPGNNNHVHFVCDNCSIILCGKTAPNPEILNMAHYPNFTNHFFHLHIHGRCQNCETMSKLNLN